MLESIALHPTTASLKYEDKIQPEPVPYMDTCVSFLAVILCDVTARNVPIIAGNDPKVVLSVPKDYVSYFSSGCDHIPEEQFKGGRG